MRNKRILIVQILFMLASCASSQAGVQNAIERQGDSIQREAETSPASSVRAVVLKEGTEVSLKFAQKLSAKAAYVGEPVELVLAQDLKIGDAVVVKQGARVLGTVVAGKESEKKRNEAHQLTMRKDCGREAQ